MTAHLHHQPQEARMLTFSVWHFTVALWVFVGAYLWRVLREDRKHRGVPKVRL